MQQSLISRLPVFAQLAVFLGIWSVFQMLFAGLLPFVLQKAIGMNNLEFALQPKQEYAQTWIWMNLISQLSIFLIPVLIFGMLSSSKPFEYLGLKSLPANILGVAVIIGILMVFCIPVMGALLEKVPLGSWADNLQENRKDVEAIYFTQKDAMSVLRNVFLLALVPAVCEEFFFRGIILRFINSFSHKPWVSILVSALIFSLFHLSAYNFIPIMLAGVILGYIFFKTGSLLAGMVVHGLYNAAQVLLQGFSAEADKELQQQLGIQIGLVFVAGTILFFLLKRWYTLPDQLPKNWSVEYKAEHLEMEKQSGPQPHNFHLDKEEQS